MSIKHDLSGKIALITGATKGIGESIAWAMGQAGATIVVCSRKPEAVEASAKAMQAQGIKAVGIACNMGRMNEVETLAEQLKAEFGKLDILVNNAGANPGFGAIATLPLASYEKTMDINLKGPLYLTQLCYPLLVAAGGGSVINIASIEGITPSENLGAYSMSKAALIMLTKVMAREWGKDNIRVNAICPGYIQTKLTEIVWKDEEYLSKVLGNQIIQHLGKPDDVAALALLLASDAGSYFTGSAVVVDGGYTV